MANAAALINESREQIVAQPEFTQNKLTKELIYRQYLPLVKEPKFPCITLVYEEEDAETCMDVSNGMLYVGIHSQDFNAIQNTVHWIGQTLHNFMTSNENVIVYKCHKKGTPPAPAWDDTLKAWGAMLAFEVSFG